MTTASSAGKIKVVFTGDPSDTAEIRKHIRRPSQNKAIQHRAKDPDDELELVIVQSMWLTGFDSPPLHTLYLDRPMRGAALMQALARVNRTFRGKEEGLLVGYAPLTENLYAALAEYTASDQAARPLGRNIDEALAKVKDLHDVIGNVILAGYDWRAALASKSPKRLPQCGTWRSELPARPGQPGEPARRRRAEPGGPVPCGSPPGWPGSTRCARAPVP